MKTNRWSILTAFTLFLGFVSCNTADDTTVLKDRGSVEVEFEDKQLKFGSNSYTTILIRQDINGNRDTVAYVYKSRIWDGHNFYDDIGIYGYYNEDGIVDSLAIEYTPLRNSVGNVYKDFCNEKPLLISNINYNEATSWLTADFEGYLHSRGCNYGSSIHLKKGKITIPMKGLAIPDIY